MFKFVVFSHLQTGENRPYEDMESLTASVRKKDVII